ncbi:lef8 [Hemileuca sp. nucleopolyhedrovirus]|uniref:DNA-directed RNA polymerase n=2 Tax=Alphabaculovirus TaxID=558016 RepID=S5MQA5_9ABAC|nr:lef8 [Hemileuca sp. nucleopolyhedrovirus]AGR56789.1 lef8 [Hemileuca sp. nucleopolyhedrovirus]
MTDVIQDFNSLYKQLKTDYSLNFYLNCANKNVNETSYKSLQERKSYLCCAADAAGRCVLHKCVPVILGTELDKEFRANDETVAKDIEGTFMIDGRNLSFPNIMMNNNILMHNFYDKLYSKSCKRMFLYGNFDEEKKINRAIQLVYDKHDDVLFARDVYARDYVVTEDLNDVLHMYLRKSGKWEPLNFIFDYGSEQSETLVDQIKRIMRVDINYSIDSLSNKIIYKHDYLLSLMFRPVLKLYESSHCTANHNMPNRDAIDENDSVDENVKKNINCNDTTVYSGYENDNDVKRKRVASTSVPSSTTTRQSLLLLQTQQQQQQRSVCKKRKLQTILYPKECKKIVETIVNGKLIYTVSKTFSKQRKNFMNYQDNSSNNNIEICPPLLKYRIGNEVVRITNDTMRQDMLMQKSDFVKFVDSFFHGEMTVAGKKFFLCRNVRLPSVNYELVREKFITLQREHLIELIENDNIFSGVVNVNGDNTENHSLRLAFNDRPTIFRCRRADLCKIFYTFKRNMSPIELKLSGDILFVNHHEGMMCLKRTVRIVETNVRINTLLTPYEYHNSGSILNKTTDIGIVEEKDDVTCLMSKLVQYYYKDVIPIFCTVPVPKLIVSLTNLKNAMPVFCYNTINENNNNCSTSISDSSNRGTSNGIDESSFLEVLPQGNSVVVAPHIRLSNKMFKLWTLVRDHRLMTAEDPYIPDVKLPIELYNHRVNKLKGKMVYNKNEVPLVKFNASGDDNNCAWLDGGLILHMAGVVVSSVKIGWIYDGKRYKIETCKNKNHFVYKVYFYIRQLNNQIIKKIDSKMNIINDTIHLKLTMITSTNDLQGIKICGIHGQKGVINGSEDLTEWMSEDGTSAQICLSPISFLSRQSNFDNVEKKYVVRGGNFEDPNAPRYPIFNIPYMFFNNTPDNIFKEFLKINHTGHEKVEGTRLDQWTINQSFAGNRLSESLQCIRGSTNLPENSGEYNVVSSLLHCNNTLIKHN